MFGNSCIIFYLLFISLENNLDWLISRTESMVESIVGGNSELELRSTWKHCVVLDNESLNVIVCSVPVPQRRATPAPCELFDWESSEHE